MRFVITTRELRNRNGQHPIPALTLGRPLPTPSSSALRLVDFGSHGTKLIWPDDLQALDGHENLAEFVGECLIGYVPVNLPAA